MSSLTKIKRPAINRFAITCAAALCFAAGAHAQEKSKGVYRIPCENGTNVGVTNDFNDHKPLGRIDMSGKGGTT